MRSIKLRQLDNNCAARHPPPGPPRETPTAPHEASPCRFATELPTSVLRGEATSEATPEATPEPTFEVTFDPVLGKGLGWARAELREHRAELGKGRAELVEG